MKHRVLRIPHPAFCIPHYRCHSAFRTPHSASEGQALVELAIFGAMSLLVMGSLISFGMNADYQQRTQMRAIRKAMWSGIRARWDNKKVPDSETYVDMESGFIPDPTNPFGMGAPTFASGSESTPTRHFKIGRAPGQDTGRELPRLVFYRNGQPVDCPSATRLNGGLSPTSPFAIHGCASAGFWNVNGVDGNGVEGFQRLDDGRLVNNPETVKPLDKYDFVFGISNIRTVEGSASCPNPPTNCKANLQITDANRGELVSKENAISICRLILDAPACNAQCRRTKKHPGSQTAISECQTMCSQPIQVPNYCSAGTPRTYLAGWYEQLFASGPSLGFQPVQGHSSLQETTMTKDEDPGGITTTSRIDRWLDISQRSFIYVASPDVFGAPTGAPATVSSRPEIFVHKDVQGKTDVWRTRH